MKITLKNNFHLTETTVHTDSLNQITKRQYHAAIKRLCGLTGCTCGGIRGIQSLPDGRRLDFEHTPDGGLVISPYWTE